MAVTYGFYNSQNHDRLYNALQMSSLFDGLILDGVYAAVGNVFAVTPLTGLTVTVDTGRCWFDHTWTLNDALLPLTLATADIYLSRIDAVVVEVNSDITVRQNSIKIVQGEVGVDPDKPDLVHTGAVNQYALAYVTVGPGATTLTSGDIEPVVGTAETPFVTGLIQVADIDYLYAQWEYQFREWFEEVQVVLDVDTAGQLLNLINQRVKYTDKASTFEAVEGLDDVKYMTPKATLASIFARFKEVLVTELLTDTNIASWVKPGNFYGTELRVMVFGGGQGATSSAANASSTGGNGGHMASTVLTIGSEITSIACSIGAGGTAGGGGGTGGSTTFGGLTAAGGSSVSGGTGAGGRNIAASYGGGGGGNGGVGSRYYFDGGSYIATVGGSGGNGGT